MSLPSPKRANSNIGKLVAFLKKHAGQRFLDLELAEEPELKLLPKVTASNAKKGGYICRDDKGYYYPLEDEIIKSEDVHTSGSTSTHISKDVENKLVKQAIQRKIEEHQRQIEILKDMLKSY